MKYLKIAALSVVILFSTHSTQRVGAKEPPSRENPNDICGLIQPAAGSRSTLAPLPLPEAETPRTQPGRWANMGLTPYGSQWVCWSPVPGEAGATFTSIVVQENGNFLTAASFTAKSGPIAGQQVATVALFTEILTQEMKMNQQEVETLKAFITEAFRNGTGGSWVPVFYGSNRFNLYRQDVGGNQFSFTLSIRR